MLSEQTFKYYSKKLDLKIDYCRVIRIGTRNVKTKLEQSQFFEENNLKTLYGEPNRREIFSQISDWSNIATFLIYISEVEGVFYDIFKKELSKFNEIQTEEKKKYEFLDYFVKVRSKGEFYPFSEVKQLVSKISATDLSYITEIIALRNYFAHGKKESQDLMIDKTNKADIALINDLYTINEQIKGILEKLKRD
jgi:hypothetical protein